MEFALEIFGLPILPWRLLVMVLALPLGVTAILLHFVYESPKYLANAGRPGEALELLAKIWKRNGNKGIYPVDKLIFIEDTNISRKHNILDSLWLQTSPLFKPPLLLRTLQLFCLIAVVYSINSGLITWFPFIAEAFFDGLYSSTMSGEDTQGLCYMISQVKAVNNSSEKIPCSAVMNQKTMYLFTAQSLIFVVISVGVSFFASRKKAVMLGTMSITAVCGVSAVLVRDNLLDFILFFGMLANNSCMGILFSYFVDLYPTSYRSMAACLGTIVARTSGLAGINGFGVYMLSHCSLSVYACSSCLVCGALISLFLPPDRPSSNKANEQQ